MVLDGDGPEFGVSGVDVSIPRLVARLCSLTESGLKGHLLEFDIFAVGLLVRSDWRVKLVQWAG